MANISSLTVSLVADTAKFSNGLKKARRDTNKFAEAAKKSAKIAGAAFAALSVGLVGLTLKSLKLVDAQRKSARTLGTSQAVYTGLSLAAGIAGLEVAGFTKALKRQAKSIVDASDGLMTQKRAFDRLGLSTRELMALPVEKQFQRITTELGKVKNATQKVAIASDIRGAKNADLINIIDLGADGLQKYIDLSKELGTALTDRQTDNIEEANDAWLIFKTSLTGLGNQLASQLAPAIEGVSGALTRFVTKVTDSVPAFAAWTANILGVERALANLTLRDLSAELSEVDSDIFATQGAMWKLQQTIDKTGENAFGGTLLAKMEAHKQKIKELEARYTAIIKARLELKKTGEVIIPDIVLPDIVVAGDDAMRGFQKRLKVTAELMKEVNEQVDTWSSEATAAFEATRTPVEEFNAAIKLLRENPMIDGELQQRAIDNAVQALQDGLDKMKEETEAASEQMTEFQRQAFSNMQDILAEFLFDPFDKGLDGMLKGFIDMLRKMVANLIAQKILTSFFGALGIETGSLVPKAIGGGAVGGVAHLVGERGPEIFTPGATGAIRPVGAITVNQSNNFSGSGNFDSATLIPILEENNRKLRGELQDDIARGAF